MANTINADSGAISGTPGVKTTADTSGVLALQADGTTVTTISSSSGNQVEISGQLKVGYGSEPGYITAEGYNAKLVVNQTGGEGAVTTELRGGGTLYVFSADLVHRVLSGYNQTFLIGTTERMRLTSTGALAFNGSSNYGTSGQVLTSNGNAPPSWQAGGISTGKAIAIAMIFG